MKTPFPAEERGTHEDARTDDGTPADERAGAGAEERVPFFGSWRAIHTAVVLCALAVMALLALFSRWPF